jgi:hypothetical protein
MTDSAKSAMSASSGAAPLAAGAAVVPVVVVRKMDPTLVAGAVDPTLVAGAMDPTLAAGVGGDPTLVAGADRDPTLVAGHGYHHLKKHHERSWGAALAWLFLIILIVALVIAAIVTWWWRRSGCHSVRNVHANCIEADGNLSVCGCVSVAGIATITKGLVTNDISGGGSVVNVTDPLSVFELRYQKTSFQEATFQIGSGTYIEFANELAGANGTLPPAASGVGRVIYATNDTGGANCELIPFGTNTINNAPTPFTFTLWAQAVSDGVSNWTVSGV